MNIRGNIKKWSIALATLLVGMAYASCDNAIYDDEGDCNPYYHIQFKYDMNMKYADAFANEVTSVTLYAFDKNGVLVQKKSESGAALADENYYITIEVDPGEYDLLAWCGAGVGESFSIPEAVVGKTTLTEMKCKMNYDQEIGVTTPKGEVNEDLKPLFHGLKHVTLVDEEGVHKETISLTKNTNVVRVVLQHLSGNDVDPAKFRFEITDDNALMAHDNSLIDHCTLRYTPWSVTAGNADINADIYDPVMQTDDSNSRAESVSVAVAEMTVGRLMTYRRPVLAIYNVEKGSRVLSVPIIDYALLVKGNYNGKMTDQEYLDRQDEYNLTFFLDEAGNWESSVIYINSWRVVLQDADLK